MGTKIYLIRHGETEGAHTRRYKGHIDVPLSENGISQVQRLSEHLSRNAELSAVYTSDLSRASRSAEIIAAPFNITPIVIRELKERNFGDWEGMSFDEIQKIYPDAFTSWAKNPLRFSPLNGESTLEVHDRVMPVFIRIEEENKGKNIAIVTHGGVTRVILCSMLEMPLENIFRIEQDFAALNIVEFWDYPIVKQINFVV
ncbi:MAG: hypothetical protein AMK71_06310 [Nitrospira bacterium SG8_35_4]|nr:MAG: hypothetical protein AMK71_06310 [Nitrospira bacterium SG8_35_4]